MRLKEPLRKRRNSPAVVVAGNGQPNWPELGQLAYETYIQQFGSASVLTGAPMPGFTELHANVQRAWAEVARRVTEKLMLG